MYFDIQKYSELYSEDELLDDLQKNNLNLEKIIELNLKELFDLSINNGLIDLLEYLYVIEGIGYELNDLIARSSPNNISSQDQCSNSTTITNPIIYDYGASSGINLQYLNNSNIKIQKSINKLMSLKKYSTLVSKNKKFYYKFNPKYTSKVISL